LRKLTLAIGLPLELVITTLYWPMIILNPSMVRYLLMLHFVKQTTLYLLAWRLTFLFFCFCVKNPSIIKMMLSELELVIPLSVDLALHLYPAVLLWIDYFVFSDRVASSSSGKIKLTKDIQLSILQLTILLTLAYVSRIELLCYFKTDVPREFPYSRLDLQYIQRWTCFTTQIWLDVPTVPYPFLNDVDFPVRLAIYSAAAGLCYMYSSLAESLHGFFFKA
jgi:hypothetical protein